MSGAQQAQAAQATGMRRMPFPLESYVHPSLPLSAKRLLNFMAEQAPSDARSEAALVPAPGLATYLTVGPGPIRAINGDEPGRVYVVSGDHFYRCSFAPRAVGSGIEDMGYVGVPTDPAPIENYAVVTIACSSDAAVVVVPPNAYTCGHNITAMVGADPLNQISGGGFPNVSSVAQLDGYFGFSDADEPGRWHITGLFDPATYSALDFASTEALPNVLRRILSHAGEFWFFGEGGIEIWYDAGNQDFPFRRIPGGVIEVGVVNKTVARVDNSFWWLGVDGMVYRSNGYKAERVSTHAVEAAILSTGGYPSWVIGGDGYTFKHGGHSFYVLTIGTRSLVYDCATKLWHDRSSASDGSLRWRPNCSSPFSGSGGVLLGDAYTGKLFFTVSNGPDDDMVPLRQFTMPPLWASTRRAFCSRVEIEMEVGTPQSNGDLLLDWSDDGGTTWSGSRTVNAGWVRQLRKRVIATRLGSFRQRVFRVSTHDTSTFYGMDADISGGVS